MLGVDLVSQSGKRGQQGSPLSDNSELNPLSEIPAISRDDTISGRASPTISSFHDPEAIRAKGRRRSSVTRRSYRRPRVSTDETAWGEPVSPSDEEIPMQHPFTSRGGIPYGDPGNATQKRSNRERDTETPNHRALMIHSSPSSPSDGSDDPLDELDRLRRENSQLRANLKSNRSMPAAPDYRSQTFHYIEDACYLDVPRWKTGEHTPILQARNKVSNADYYLEQHPEIAFCISKEYKSRVPADRSKIETRDGVFRKPKPYKEYLQLMAGVMRDAVNKMARAVPNFEQFFPHFDVRRPISAPYLFLFYSTPYLDDILPELDGLSQRLIEKLRKKIDESYGSEYDLARTMTEEGKVSSQLFKYLIKPGDILIRASGPKTQAYMALDWAQEDDPPDDGYLEDYEEFNIFQRKPTYSFRDDETTKFLRFSWSIPVTCWHYDGVFERHKERLKVTMKVSTQEETVQISKLDIVPLHYAPKGVKETLQHRGETFWQIRYRKFVTYSQVGTTNLTSVRSSTIPLLSAHV